MSRTCQISEIAALSESFTFALMALGNKAQVQVLHLENRPIPPHLKSYVRKNLRRSVYNNNKLGFITPSGKNFIVWSEVLEHIPFETIGKFVGIGFPIYGYSKLIIVSYQYGKQFFNKFKARQQKLLLTKQIRFVVVRLFLRMDFSTHYKLFT
jgi:hypothetical protein